MADFVFTVIALGFLGLCALYVRACERIIAGADDDAGTEPVVR